ncbi:MAG: hypothetical protein QOK14_115 [Frankiaceae bacterium]|nr:hypothetical protein [Frankiaceae bacterium]
MNESYAPRVPDNVPAQRRDADANWTFTSERPLDLLTTLDRLGRGPGDPTHQVTPGGDVWRTARSAAGTATYRLRQHGRNGVDCLAWGSGAADVVARLPELVGERDDHSGFQPGLALLEEAHRRHLGLRTPRTTFVLDALMAAVIEQRVLTIDARAAWRRLHMRFGDAAPGPCPAGMRLPLSPGQWLGIPSWEWHRAGVDPGRARTARACAQVAGRVEEAAYLPQDGAARRLMAIPGVGVWTAAEVAQRALGDSDAESVGDYHLARNIGWTLVGRPVDDDVMLELLAPWQPYRYRVVRLLDVSGSWHRPRFGPRSPRDTSYKI